MRCNLCENTTFTNMGPRLNVRCVKCGSLERTRLLWLYLQRLNLTRDTRVLHIAPERGLYDALRGVVAAENYVCADFNPSLFRFAPGCRQIDLRQLSHWPSEEFDLILHSHVLEHIPCNIASPLFHLHRMLKPSGKHVFVIPFMGGNYEESFEAMPEAERVQRFGQNDHVRRFGRNDVPMHIGSILQLPRDWDAQADFTAQQLEDVNIPREQWNGFNGSTVFVLDRSDMLGFDRQRS